jgi:hypothetical protein
MSTLLRSKLWLRLTSCKQQEDGNRTYEKGVIYFDSQAAAKGLSKPNKQSGQQILLSTLQKIESVTALIPNITLIWIPGHMEIAGNENADEAAKEAAKSKIMDTNSHHKPPRFNTIYQSVKKVWHEAWENGKDGTKPLRRITKFQSGESMKLYNNITNRTSLAQLVRLRTGHCSLNQYLHRFGIEESHHYANAGTESSKMSNTIYYIAQGTTDKGPNSGKRLE